MYFRSTFYMLIMKIMQTIHLENKFFAGAVEYTDKKTGELKILLTISNSKGFSDKMSLSSTEKTQALLALDFWTPVSMNLGLSTEKTIEK